MRCPDGIRLASRLWTPSGPGPWPALLMRQPYGSALASTVTYAHPGWYAAHGFLVVVQDVRGKGDSEGSFGGFAQEASDSAAAVRWVRGLTDCDGRVGTYGFSYHGLSQLLNAGERSGRIPDPLPDCLAPAMCGLDERRDWASEGGAHWWALGLGWALQLAAQEARRRGDLPGWASLRRSLDTGAYLDDGLSLLARHDPEGMGLAWLRADPLTTEGWRVHASPMALLRRPMLLIGGWHDPHLRGVLDLWRRARASGGQPTLLVGAWSHLDWNGGADREQLAFFRHHLQGGGSHGRGDQAAHAAARPGVRSTAPGESWLQDASSGVWFRLEATSASALPSWRLVSDGLAAIRCDEGLLVEGSGPAGGGAVVVVHDPWRPVPGRGGHLGGEARLVDRQDLDRRGDVACFTTLPLTGERRWIGQPSLRLRVGADQPGFDLCASLAVVGADGQSARVLSTGVLRVLGQEALDPLERTVRLQPLAATLRSGERLRLSLAGAAWPQVAVNGGDGSQPRGGPSAAHRLITLTLWLEEAQLVLRPLLPLGSDGVEPSLGAN
jgi:putative CocE/NonD family hydrolase